jgi:uncharacterized membrane protein
MSHVSSSVAGLQALRHGCVAQHDAGMEVSWEFSMEPALSPRQGWIVWLLLCVPCLGIAMVFWWWGVRWVLPFAGLEAAVAGVALWVSLRRTTERERILLRADGLVVERWQGRRREREELPMPWVRVEARPDGRAPVELRVRERVVSVGRRLRPAQRTELARDLRIALRCLA